MKICAIRCSYYGLGIQLQKRADTETFNTCSLLYYYLYVDGMILKHHINVKIRSLEGGNFDETK